MANENEKLENVSAPEEVVEKAPKEKKAKKGFALSKNVLHWIYFGVSLILVVLAGIVLGLKVSKPFTLLGLEASPTSIKDLIDGFIDTVSGGGSVSIPDIMSIVIVLGVVVYLIAGVITTVVYFIIMLVKALLLIKKPKDDKSLESSFHEVERKFVAFFAVYLAFDCFILSGGGAPAPSFALEVIMLSLILIGNGVYAALRKQFGRGKKSNVADLIYDLVELVVLYLTLFAICFGLLREKVALELVFNPYIKLIQSMSNGSPDVGAVTNTSAGILKLVGFFLAISMIGKVAQYYPYDDSKKAAEGEPYAINSLLGKTIAALVLYSIAGIVCFTTGFYESIGDVVKSGPFLLLMVLGVAICLRVARKVNSAKVEEKPSEKAEKEAE
jgi:hypothetical protein